MARTWQKTNLKLVYTYRNDEGDMVKKSKTYSDIYEKASEEDLYEVGECIASMQKHRLVDVLEIVTNKLTEE